MAKEIKQINRAGQKNENVKKIGFCYCLVWVFYCVTYSVRNNKKKKVKKADFTVQSVTAEFKLFTKFKMSECF